MKILAIETSCDETAIAILENNETNFHLLSSVVLSQIKVHQPFGGVVPNLAMREHQKNLVPILTGALRNAELLQGRSIKLKTHDTKKQSKIKKHNDPIYGIEKKLSAILLREHILLAELKKFVKKYVAPDIEAIAVTHGPGLEPALWVGINFAKALSTIWKKPIIPVNHLEGHMYAGFMPKNHETSKKFSLPQAKEIFPALALIVSGGHTELVLIKKHLDYKVLGSTRDDAAGEAFDKVAKMLKLGYPGGPEISKIAEQGNPTAVDFPRPMIDSPDFDFSFSGLKTSVLYYIRDKQLDEIRTVSESTSEPATNYQEGLLKASGREKKQLSRGLRREETVRISSQNKADIAASFEQAVIDVLVSKTAKALKKYEIKSLVVGGGVAANKKLRSSLEYMIKLFPDTQLHLSPLWLAGDNAAMIAMAAYFRLCAKKTAKPSSIKAQGNLPL